MTNWFALPGQRWSEYSQAKYDLRRMLGDLGHDIESSVFALCDFNHQGREINRKGLLRANADHDVIAVKRAYYAVQNVASIFDDRLTRVKNSTFRTDDRVVLTYEYLADGAIPVLVYWDEQRRQAKPSHDFLTRPGAFDYNGKPLSHPVWVDLLTGGVYEYRGQVVHSCGITFLNIPVYDSPCAITERDFVL